MGTTFTVYLPRRGAVQQPATAPGRARSPRSRGETVLRVEDEPAIMKMNRIMLQRLGYGVLQAGMAFIQKPFSVHERGSNVRSMLEGR